MTLGSNGYEVIELDRELILGVYGGIAPLHFPREELRSMENLRGLLERDGYWGLGIFREGEYGAARSADSGFREGECRASGTAECGFREGEYDSEDVLGALLGYALFVHVPGERVALLDFLAVKEEFRDLGLGSIFLRGIREFASRKGLTGLYIETEDLEYASTEAERQVRLRRNAFYERNGARLTGFGTTVFGVAFSIFYLEAEEGNHAVLPLEVNKLRQGLERIYRFMLPPALYDTKVLFR